MTSPDLKGQLTATVSHISLLRTASANGAALDTQQYQGDLLALVECAAKTAGTNPTADFTLEDSADNSSFAGNTAALSAAFTQVTTVAATQTRKVDLRATRRYVRLVFTIGGTSSPSFSFSSHFIGQLKVI